MSGQDWIILQRKLFSRWCRQKLARRHDIPQITDIVNDIKEGPVLFALIEELSGTKYPDQKAIPKPGSVKTRIKQIEALSLALKWTWSIGVELKLKPSAEDLADGKESAVLALVWALMMRFMKIGDDEDAQQLNAKEALLLWVNNKCPELSPIDSFKKSPKSPFHNGLALCSLIHKHRPKLLPNYESLTPENALQNIEIAQDAAYKYFQLEKFLTPTDVTKLDDSSMVVYVSEFYYGIAEQRKLDLAARRISKLIKLTKENDKLKEDYKATAAAYKQTLVKVEEELNDRTIDNTMAGAKKRLEGFYKYKTEDKNVLLGSQLKLEGLFNSLSMRLSHHKRPEFVPPEGVTLSDVRKALLHLEVVEQERSRALHAELNRQIKLVKLDEQHKTLYDNLCQWIAEKEKYLKTKEIIESVSSAQFHLRKLEAFDKESQSVQARNAENLKKIGRELLENKYENQTRIEEREKDITDKFAVLDQLSKEKMPVLKDDLEREIYKQKTRLLFQEHTEKNDAICKWIAESRDYLNTREKVYSVTEAHTQLSLRDSFEEEKVLVSETNVKEMKRLGEEIMARKYETQYSQWAFENPEEIQNRFKNVDEEWENLRVLSEEKKRVLDDHLKREELRERYRIANQQHVDMFNQISEWIAEKEIYLQTFPSITSVADCTVQLSLFSAYEQENKSTRETLGFELKNLGDDIRAVSHSSKYSTYKFDHTVTNEPPFEENNEENRKAVDEREKLVSDKFENLEKLAIEFKKVLDDHKKREDFAMSTRTLAQTHLYMFKKLEAWCNAKHAFLNAREKICSISEAQTHLTLLEQYNKENKTTISTTLAQFKTLTSSILDAVYSSEYGQYTYEHTKYSYPSYDHEEREKRELINTHLKDLEKHWETLAEEEKLRKTILEDHLARETFARKLRLLDQQHKKQFSKILEWGAAKKKYLSSRPTIASISDAQTQLSIFESYEKEVAMLTQNSIAKMKELGETIIPQTYKSEFSSFVCENPEEIKERSVNADKLLEDLSTMSKDLKKYLDDSLALELEKERLRLEYAHRATELVRFVSETSKDLAIETFGFTLEEVQEYKKEIDSSKDALQNSVAKDINAIKELKSEMDKIGVKDNIYTQLSLEDIDQAKSDLDAALNSRDTAYKAELDRQIANDNLCKQFAEVAEQFSKNIIEQKDKITGSKSDLESQLDFVQSLIAKLPQEGEKLKPIKELAEKMENAGITDIRHTTLTAKDVEVQWEQFQKFLHAKKEMLISEIENSRLRGITPEQFKEIETNFQQFDKDKNEIIDRKELTACLYSLGEEKTGKEITEIMKEYGDQQKGGITYEGFKNFMIKILGDSDTKDEIMESLALINKHDKLANHESMELVVNTPDLEYFESTAPKVDTNHWDYVAWVNDMFSR